jgi:hypothetical protein
VAVVVAGHHHGLHVQRGAQHVGGLEGAKVADVGTVAGGAGLADLVLVALAIRMLDDAAVSGEESGEK